MPMIRYQIRNEYSLADPQLYKVAGKDDTEGLLQGVAMAGLVGLLRQLGDLAQFAAEIFHDLHEEVMSTSARGHSLIARVQQLEADFPSVEKTILLQTRPTAFLYNSGMDWHHNHRMNQNPVAQQDLPRFVLDSYEECRGPPRLFLLDKFDVAGAGASLKRYTDPSFFREATSSTNRKSDEQRERRVRKVKKRGPHWRNGDTPVTYLSSHAKLHQLFLEENAHTAGTPEDTGRRVKLKNRQFSGSLLDQNKGRSYMEEILIDENCVDSLALTRPFENGCEYSHGIVVTGTFIPLKKSTQTAESPSLLNNMDMMIPSSMDDFSKQKSDEIFAIEADGVDGYGHGASKIVLGEESYDGQRRSEVGVNGHNSDGFASEIDNYLDVLATTDSEIETESEGKNPHYSNLKSVMKDSDTSEGKRKYPSKDSVISEDDLISFKGQDCSSCSVSVKTPVDDHSMAEEILEKGADRSSIVEDYGSSEIGFSEEYSPVDEDGSLQKICLLNEESDEINSDALKPVMTSRIGDGDANQSAVWSFNGQVADGAEETHKGHWSHGELSMLDTAGGNSFGYCNSFPDLTHTHDGSGDLLLEASISPDSVGPLDDKHSSGPNRGDVADILDAGLSPDNSFISDFKHPEIAGPIGLASNKDFKAATESLSNTPEDHVIKGVIADVKSEKEAPSPSSFSIGSSEDEEVRGCSIVTGDLTSVLEFSAAQKHRQPLSEGTDAALLEHHLGEPIEQCLELDNGNPQCSSSSLNPEVVQEHFSGINGCHQNGERRTSELEALKCVDSLKNTHANLDSCLCNSSSDSLAKHLQNNRESTVEVSSTSVSNALNEELITPSMKGLNPQVDESLGAVEMSSQSLLYSHQIQTLHYSHGLPSVSQFSPRCEHSEECPSQSIIKPSPNFLGHDAINDHNRAINGVDNSGKPVFPIGFPTLGMLPTEPQINLDATPLPPLPPMQWILSKFQNSSAAPERHTLQHTLDPSQPKHAMVLVKSSIDEKCGFEEENLSITAASMSLGSRNGTQLSENGYVAQPGASVALEGQVLQHTIDFVQPTMTTVVEAPSHDNVKEFRSEDTLSLAIPTSVRCHIETQVPTNGYAVYFENNMNGVKREDDPSLIPTSTCYPDGNQMYEGSYHSCVDLHESTSLVDDHSCGNSQIVVEAKADIEVGNHDEQLKHISEVNNEEVMNSDFQFLPSSNCQPSDLLSPKAGRTNDGVHTNAGADTKETLQKKPPRPRNPLIDEVVAIDKSKLRKVERVKSSWELKPGDDLLLEQMQLKKVVRVKPLVEGKAADRVSSLQHVQLRKGGVIAEAEPNPDEKESSRVQLRKVPKRVYPVPGSKSMERDSLLEQIRTKSFNLKPAAMSKPNLQCPRANLRVAAILEKASNIRQAMAGSDEEDDGDSWSDC